MAIVCLSKNNLVFLQISSKWLLRFMLNVLSFPHIWEVTAAGTTEPFQVCFWLQTDEAEPWFY